MLTQIRPFGTKFNNLNNFSDNQVENIKKRFFSKIDKNGPVVVSELGTCWEWMAWKFPGGYGAISVASRSVRANRLSYILTYGYIPDGLGVLHRCNYAPCCRPDHLYLGNAHSNAIDRENSSKSLKGDRNGSRIHPESRPWGEKVNTVKLTVEKVLEIRNMYKFGEITFREISEIYHVNRTNIRLVVIGKTWKRVGGPIFTGPTKEQVSEMKRRAARGGRNNANRYITT